MPLILCVVSQVRERGKTGLIERLTKKFNSEGFRVATVKHIHGSFDTAKKDTWRHLEAGAALTIASTPTEVVAIRRSIDPSLEEALESIYVDPDLVLVEGYKRSSNPKVLCADTVSDVQVAMKEIPNIIMVSGSVANKTGERRRLKAMFPDIEVCNLEELVSAIKEGLMKEVLRRLPGLNCGHCGFDSCLELARAILRNKATIEDCEVLATDISTLKVDDKIIPIGKFPQEIIRQVTLGILSSLKDVGKHPKKIEIRIKI